MRNQLEGNQRGGAKISTKNLKMGIIMPQLHQLARRKIIKLRLFQATVSQARERTVSKEKCKRQIQIRAPSTRGRIKHSIP